MTWGEFNATLGPGNRIVTHRFSLEDYAEAYRVFTEREDGALQVIVRP